MRFAIKTIVRTGSLFVLLLWSSPGLYAAETSDHVPGRLLVGSRATIDWDLVSGTLRLHRAVLRRQMPELGVSILDVPEESSSSIMDSLRRTGLFAYVERDSYAHTGAVPNDPSYVSQWYLQRIQSPQAWGLTTGTASVIVAVVDSGVDGTHPDLAPKLVPGWNFVKSSADTMDVVGHGTAVAGTLAAASNNGLGITGVSWASPIMPLAVVDDDDFAAYSNVAAAIRYAADHGVRVINISIGGTTPSVTLQNAVDYAWSKGAVIFASAMNDGLSTPNYPAACHHVVAVSATDSGNQLATFSNYGDWITLAAPGTNILTTMNGGGYGFQFGTSFATPIVAGVAALCLAIRPALTNSELVALLEQNADGTGAVSTYFGWGRINAYRAVQAALPPPDPPKIQRHPRR